MSRKQIKELWVDFISIVKSPNQPRNNESVILAADNNTYCYYQQNIAFGSEQTKVFAIVWKPYEDVHLDNGLSVWIDEESLERSAHNFLGCCHVHQIDTNHDNEATGAFVSESYIKRGEDSLFPHAPIGTWIVALICPAEIDTREITGVSIQAKFNTYNENQGIFMSDETEDDQDHQNLKSDGQANTLLANVEQEFNTVNSELENLRREFTEIKNQLDSLKSEMTAHIEGDALESMKSETRNSHLGYDNKIDRVDRLISSGVAVDEAILRIYGE